LSAQSALRVDAHHHVWQLARGDYGWLTPKLAPIYRDFSLDDLRPLLREAGIGATVLVQAAPTEAETRFLLATANASAGLVCGVVGWVDCASPDAVARLTALARDPLLKSVRPMLQDIPDPEWILRPEVRPAIEALPQLGLRFDALVVPAQLPALLRLLERHSGLAVVIDHGAKPPIAAGLREPWAGHMSALARHPNVHCKLSGLVTEAGAGWSADSLSRYVEHLLWCFGPTRLIWGSDWPVVELAGGYRRWVAATDALLSGLAVADQEAIRGGNARRFYRLA
jgi:L-fuconolactonase